MIPMILWRFIAFFYAALITPVALADEATRNGQVVVTVKSPEAIQSVQKLLFSWAYHRKLSVLRCYP